MKIKDFIKRTGFVYPEDECDLCALHDAYNISMECPKCHSAIYPDYNNMKVVGETNGPQDDEEMYFIPVYHCDDCGTTLGLFPIPIIWSANHDVYYTGGRSFVMGDIDFKKKLLPDIQQYHNRLLEGEKLKPWQLEAWLKGTIESIVADYLYSAGLKK